LFSIAYLAARSHTPTVDALMNQGFRVWEALSVSEVLYLCEHEVIDIVVIAAEVTDPEIKELKARRITLQLGPDTEISALLWELGQLFPNGGQVQ
jgi:hypothetical protein